MPVTFSPWALDIMTPSPAVALTAGQSTRFMFKQDHKFRHARVASQFWLGSRQQGQKQKLCLEPVLIAAEAGRFTSLVYLGLLLILILQ